MENGKLSSTSISELAPTENLKLWKVLIYMAADNNLKEESVYSLTEILRSIKSAKVGIIAQLDSGEAVTLYDFNDLSAIKSAEWLGPRGLDVIGKTLISDPEILRRSSDAMALEKFLIANVDDSCLNLVVLSGHGDGAVGDFLSSKNPPGALSIDDLSSVLDSVKGKINKAVDVLGMDSCLMSMVEVCYGLRKSVSYLVGAEGFSRNTGWPYYEILTALQNSPELTPEELSRRIVKEYVHFYAPYTISGVSVDQVACDLSETDNLRAVIRVLAERLREALEQENSKVEDAILLAHWRSQSYKMEQYVDLWDFCELLKLKCCDDNENTIADACRDVQLAIEKVVLLSCYSGGAFQYSKGLSIYFPWAKADLDKNLPYYSGLEFAKDTRWGEFLDIYGSKTQRPPNTSTENKAGKPTQISMPVESDIGIGLASGKIRSNLLEGTKTNLLEGTKGGRIVIPMMKNPPNSFLKYQDDCAVEEKPDKKLSAT